MPNRLGREVENIARGHVTADRPQQGRSEPVFIVGPSRSGTSMLREMLNRHRAVWIARETHYFDDLRPRLGERARVPLSPGDRDQCERYFLALGHRAYGHAADVAQSAIDAEELRREASRRGGSADAYFEAFCTGRAREQGRPRWGEKTPRHVFRIGELLAVFPEARIICLVRDPRAVAASYRDWKRGEPLAEELEAAAADRKRIQGSYNVVVHALLWRSAITAALQAHATYGSRSVRLQRYEDLVERPKQTLQSLSDWLGLEYDEAMLDVPVVQSSYRLLGAGVSTEPVARWQQKLPPAEIAVMQTCCRRVMREFGYEVVAARAPVFTLVRTWMSTPAAFARAIVLNRGRIARLPEYLGRRVGLALRRSQSAAG